MSTIEIPVRELHARTGHYVRKASANVRVIVTDNGKPIAEIKPFSFDDEASAAPYFSRRKLLPAFKKLLNGDALKPKQGQRSIDEILDEERADREL